MVNSVLLFPTLFKVIWILYSHFLFPWKVFFKELFQINGVNDNILESIQNIMYSNGLKKTSLHTCEKYPEALSFANIYTLYIHLYTMKDSVIFHGGVENTRELHYVYFHIDFYKYIYYWSCILFSIYHIRGHIAHLKNYFLTHVHYMYMVIISGPWKRAYPIVQTKFNSLHHWIICVKLNWTRSVVQEERFFKSLQCIFIISHLFHLRKRDWPVSTV